MTDGPTYFIVTAESLSRGLVRILGAKRTKAEATELAKASKFWDHPDAYLDITPIFGELPEGEVPTEQSVLEEALGRNSSFQGGDLRKALEKTMKASPRQVERWTK